MVVGAYQKKELRQALRSALDEAAQGKFTTIVVQEGMCIQKTRPSSQRVAVDALACKACGVCLICPGLEVDAAGVPFSGSQCSGCGGQTPACVQMCPTGVLKAVDLRDLKRPARPVQVEPPLLRPLPAADGAAYPQRLALGIRGVGGQGNLFFGHVLARLAFLAGYHRQNIIKGDTHGMAQMGGPVISTFACGQVSSPVLLPGSADCLIVMEKSEVLRPGFLEMLKPGGTILLADTRILPMGLAMRQYPGEAAIHAGLSEYQVIEVDALGKAQALGDAAGRIANVVMLGVLSTLEPFSSFPEELWLHALQQANTKPAIWAANYAAFQAGRELAAEAQPEPAALPY
jgi:indolepyruvate ferredoxin oxidoreductase alpha subunit